MSEHEYIAEKLINSAELMTYASRFSVWSWSIEDHERFLDCLQWCIDSTPPVANNIELRCRNCRHGKRIDDVVIWCEGFKKYFSENFFCGFGE